MLYDFLVADLDGKNSKKAIGTDKGLAKIGDGIVNLAYSMAKSIYLTRNNKNNLIIRTGRKVSKEVLANALKNANLKECAKKRADAHDMADTVEALVAFIWLNNKMDLEGIIKVLTDNLSGNLYDRREEINSAIVAFTELLNQIKRYMPQDNEK